MIAALRRAWRWLEASAEPCPGPEHPPRSEPHFYVPYPPESGRNVWAPKAWMEGDVLTMQLRGFLNPPPCDGDRVLLQSAKNRTFYVVELRDVHRDGCDGGSPFGPKDSFTATAFFVGNDPMTFEERSRWLCEREGVDYDESKKAGRVVRVAEREEP